ncbi:MAG: hypothetical protein QOE33_2315 [Acidobacteriota bacterium]|nr:hypothetical protein [Acidobacteriota bacterium]
MTLENMTRESFAENLNTKFSLLVESGEPLEIELVEASEAMRVGASERFSIIFRGAGNFFLQQGSYHLEHERLGALDIFIVPIAREQDGFRYEAVFNRLVGEAARG